MDEYNIFLCVINEKIIILNKSEVFEDVLTYQYVNGFKLPIFVQEIKQNIKIINCFKSQNHLIDYINDADKYQEIKLLNTLNSLKNN